MGSLMDDHPSSQDYDSPLSLLNEAVDLTEDQICLIDSTGAKLTELHLASLRRGIPVITANKKPASDSYDAYAEIQRLGRRKRLLYWYETTAGAGLPVISTLQDLVLTGDTVLEISGCLSGTLGYICSQLDTGRPFSEIVNEASEQGYTEPDPRDDLNGMDVARKALILAREIGCKLNISDVQIESMVSDELEAAESVDAFMDQLPSVDNSYRLLVEESRSKGQVLRYLATVKDGRCDVRLRSVPADSPAGSLSGPDNLVVYRTARYSDNPLVIRGPGAGPDVTAAGLFADLIRAASVYRL
jgi:bifunctional aspartokinase / homoserine dehydrogenase 1